MRILIKVIAACLAVVTTIVIWLMIDAPLDEETRRWLEPPPPPESTSLDAATHLRALADSANGEDVSKADVGPDGHCALLDQRCAEYVAAHRAHVLAALPQSEGYWDAYDRVLHSEGLSANLEQVLQLPPWQAYMDAFRFSVMRELASSGQLRPKLMAQTVNAQRRLLAESPFLIDKMVFAATTAMSFTALELALQTTLPDDPGFGEMVHAVRPLSTAEVSLRRAMGGEMRYMASQAPEEAWSSLFFKRRNVLNLQRRMLVPSVEESELTGKEFWDSEPRSRPQLTWWDTVFDPVGATLASVAAPAYAEYAENLQILNVRSEVLRAWAATLSGEPYPSTGSTPGGLSHWVWRRDSESLCLIPTADAPRASHGDSICQNAAR